MKTVVTEIMASGAGGGAQVSVQNLVTRLDPARYDVEVISLSDGPAVRRLRAADVTVHVVDDPDDATALAAVVELLTQRPPEIVHNHMYRAEIIGTRAALALAERGLPRPFVVSTIHSSRIRSPEDRAIVRRLTPSMDRLIAVSRAIIAKLVSEGRTAAPGRAHLQRRRSQEVRVHRRVLHAARGIRLSRGHAARRRRRPPRAREGPPDPARSVAAGARTSAECPPADHRRRQPARRARGPGRTDEPAR